MFHIKRYEGGMASAALGHAIRLGHKVTINGPYGHAFYREAASRLFHALHKAEAQAKPRIAVAPVPEEGIGRAINDRLRRAAAPREP